MASGAIPPLIFPHCQPGPTSPNNVENMCKHSALDRIFTP